MHFEHRRLCLGEVSGMTQRAVQVTRERMLGQGGGCDVCDMVRWYTISNQ